MATTRLYLDQRARRDDGTYPLKITISHKGSSRHLSLGVFIRSGEWDGRAQRVVARSDRQHLNNYLAARRQAVDAILLALVADGTAATLTAAQLKARVVAALDPAAAAAAFLSHFLAFANAHKGRTKESYLGTYHHLVQHIGTGDIAFAAITRQWLEGFDEALAATCRARNARNVHLRNIRAAFNAAIDEGLTDCYPFRRFHIRPAATAHRALTVDELRRLFSYPCEAWQQQYVDIFKLIFFLCGINIGDLFHLTAISGGRVEYERAKTHKLYSIKVEPEAQALFDKYKGRRGLLAAADRYHSHADFARRVNRAVQHIGTYQRRGRGGRKVYTPLFPTITTYWMRHTWATIAADLDIPVDTISRALGHSQTTGARVTSVYIAFDRAKVDAANRRVLDWVLYGKK